ncbi:MAG: 50S ribosomal protein L32 [Actinomycetota bacterium]|nr:50S ribosomal protein L32 [Actinomycetota bacterium]
MAVPKKKLSRSRTRRRRAMWKVTAPRTIPCPQCHGPKLSHRACPNCGTYRGREVIAES